jgi:hypothetical protein
MGKETNWRVICAEFKPHFHGQELGASSINEELAWINSVKRVKNIIQEELVRKLEQ